MKILLPTHYNSGNRGCQGITEGTCQILKTIRNIKIYAFTQNINLDKRLGLGNSVILKNLPIGWKHNPIIFFAFKVFRKVIAINKKNNIQYISYRYIYNDVISLSEPEDIVLSTGGDLFCYEDDNEVLYMISQFFERKAKTVLWGCSIGKENLTEKKITALKQFDYIVARESLTADMLKSHLGLENVYLFPDPAFVIEPKLISLPESFENSEAVGINLSNFVGQDVSSDTIFGKNIRNLIKYILINTQMDILLIPHVFWKGQDDRIICSEIYEEIKDNARMHILESEKLSYSQIRYVISKCKYFIGARTHAIISAYSTCVPSIALGYSVKSHGIAKDLGLPEETVVDYRNLKAENELVDAFDYLTKNGAEIRKHMEEIMPSYRAKAYEAEQVVLALVEKQKE